MEDPVIRPVGGRNNVSDRDLERLTGWFEDSEEATRDARELSNRDADYYDNKQLTQDELDTLKDRGQPDVVINKIAPKIDFLLGLESQQRSDPKGFPRNPADEDAAHAVTDGLRFVKDKENLDQIFSKVWEDMLKSGFGGCEIHVRRSASGQVEIDVKGWDFDRIFYDPHSSRHDFADARYMGGVVWMDQDEAQRRWPRKKAVISQTIDHGNRLVFEDKPEHLIWGKRGRRPRVRIVQIYWKDGDDWSWAVFTKGGILEGGPVPYVDEEGRSQNPMILQAAYVDRDNNRYGVIRRLIGAQDEINARRSKMLHMLTMRQTIGEADAVDDVDDMKRELARPDGHIEVNPGARFEFVDQTIQTAGQAQLLSQSNADIEQLGPNAALQGKGDDRASGRAIIASQQGGVIEIAVLTDRLRHFKRRVYEAIWNRIRLFWDQERWIRVTDNEDNVRFVGFNRPVTVGEEFRRSLIEQEGLSEEDADTVIRQIVNATPARLDQMRQVIRVENVPAQMDMDINIEEAPDTVSIQQEQFNELAQMAGAGVPIPPRVLIKASSLRNKDELLEEMDTSEIAQAEAQRQAVKDQVDLDLTVAETQDKRASAMKKLAEVEELSEPQLPAPQ